MASAPEALKTAARAGVQLAGESIVGHSKGWLGKILGFGVGFMAGEIPANLGGQFSKSDEHTFHDLMNRMRKENPENAEILQWFIETLFPNPGLGFNQVINFYQNAFRIYVKRRGIVKEEHDKDGKEIEVYKQDLAYQFLVEEIVQPIKDSLPNRMAGFKKVIRYLTALDVPLPPLNIEKHIERHARHVGTYANNKRSASKNLLHWLIDKTKI